jgi:hypothetical protein
VKDVEYELFVLWCLRAIYSKGCSIVFRLRREHRRLSKYGHSAGINTGNGSLKHSVRPYVRHRIRYLFERIPVQNQLLIPSDHQQRVNLYTGTGSKGLPRKRLNRIDALVGCPASRNRVIPQGAVYSAKAEFVDQSVVEQNAKSLS